MEEEERQRREEMERRGEGRGGKKRKQLYRDPWVAVKLLVEKVLRSSNQTLKLSPDKF